MMATMIEQKVGCYDARVKGEDAREK